MSIYCLPITYRLSGKRDLNPRLSAWEADALPLSYSRINEYYQKNLKWDTVIFKATNLRRHRRRRIQIRRHR